MAFDYKKEYREFYLPPAKPVVADIPPMNFVAVRGCGNLNEEGGEYKRAIEILYAVSYTLKMSKHGKYKMEGYFDYVVPPLEGLWWLKGVTSFDYACKDQYNWISMIRLPEFVKKKDFTGHSLKPQRRKKLMCQQRNFIRSTRDCAFNVCMSAATITNR